MIRPVVIVDPLSSGIDLAPAFRARGIPAIGVTLETREWPEFGSKLRREDFAQILPEQPRLAEILAKVDPIAILPGTEEGIPLAERLTALLTPQFSNDLGKSRHRAHKAFMQAALEEAGIPALKTLHTASESEAEAWLAQSGLRQAPIVVKPPASSGSEKVFHIAANGDWRKAFRGILDEPSVVSGKCSETVVLQELAVGTEFAVGTVSAHGKHYLTHLMRYHKTSAGERRTVFDHVEFVPYREETLGALWAYTQRVLDGLGIRWGAAHTEIMLTAQGPRLIESSPRMIGGPVTGFARAATGSSQCDRLVEIFADGDVQTKEYVFRKTVVPVFLKARTEGTVANLEALEGVTRLTTLLSQHLFVKNGDRVPQTVDYLTSIGIIGLSGDRDAIFQDYERIRKMESQLVFNL